MAPKCPSFVEETLDKVALAVECVIAITPHLRNFGGITGVTHESIDQRIGIKGNVGSHFRAVVLHTSDRGPVPASTSIRNDYYPARAWFSFLVLVSTYDWRVDHHVFIVVIAWQHLENDPKLRAWPIG
jgi:hypothetical protein